MCITPIWEQDLTAYRIGVPLLILIIAYSNNFVKKNPTFTIEKAGFFMMHLIIHLQFVLFCDILRYRYYKKGAVLIGQNHKTMLVNILFPLLWGVMFILMGNLIAKKWTLPTHSLHFPKFFHTLIPENQVADANFFVRCGCMLVAGEVFILMLLSLVISMLMFRYGNFFHPLAVAISTSLPFLLVMLKLLFPNQKQLHSFVKLLALCGVVVLTAEVLVFNAKSFTLDREITTLTIDDITFEEGDNLKKDGNQLIIKGDCEMFLNDLPQNARGFIFHMNQVVDKDARVFHVWMDMEDDNFRYAYQIVADTYTLGGDDACVMSFSPYGNLYSMRLHFAQIANPVTLNEILAVPALPYEFSLLRYLFLMGICTVVLAVIQFRLYAITYDWRKPPHQAIAIIMVVLCTFSAMQFYDVTEYEELTEYHKEEQYPWTDPYTQTFHALNNGRVALEIEVAPELEKLENPYDNSARREFNTPAAWDYAYYHGNYYSYFGIAPVLTYYAPYILSHGKIPTTGMANDFFATLSIFFMGMALLSAVRLMTTKPNFLLLLASFPALTACTGAYYCMEFSDKYFVAVASAQCYLALTLWLGLWGVAVKKKLWRCLLFAGCGLALALTVASRPSICISAAILLPFFFGILCRKSEPIASRITQALSFALPLFVGIGGIMVYNAKRFSSPFDFGATYQLTVSNVNANHLQLSLLPSAFLHYFLQLPEMRGTFPYFQTSCSHLRNYGTYVYMEGVFSALMNPFAMLGACLMPIAYKRKLCGFHQGITNRQRNIALALCFIVPVILAWMDFCMGGLNIRYICDITPLLFIGCIVVLLRTTDIKNKMYRYVITLILLILSALIIWVMLLGIRDGLLMVHNPTYYDTMKNTLIFWH